MKYSPMWETENAFYHFSDKQRAMSETKNPILKYTISESDFFIGTWHFKKDFKHVFDTEEEAEQFINSNKNNH